MRGERSDSRATRPMTGRAQVLPQCFQAAQRRASRCTFPLTSFITFALLMAIWLSTMKRCRRTTEDEYQFHTQRCKTPHSWSDRNEDSNFEGGARSGVQLTESPIQQIGLPHLRQQGGIRRVICSAYRFTLRLDVAAASCERSRTDCLGAPDHCDWRQHHGRRYSQSQLGGDPCTDNSVLGHSFRG